ncbi:MAG TPA: sterol desaturase family protein [Bacteroidia bacterium]|jgi:sterol desaturase/sphingolipid hydroxylase (fatty acid hydroxylase superfamily)|nr:sterol desaturase family protein [Bacteroidia bacterium]
MKIEIDKKKLRKDISISLALYILPIALMLGAFAITGQQPWNDHSLTALASNVKNDPGLLGWINSVFQNMRSWGLTVLVLALGILELSLGLYDDDKWTKNEKTLDIICFVLPKIVIAPITAYFSLKFLPYILPNSANAFAWVPFWWGFVIIAVADDLTQYWYHRLHHQVPFLWKFHRTHHSAPYMGMSMASRQNIIYTFFFSQTYLTATLVYLGLGFPALFVRVIKSLITTFAHSSVAWDKPLYRIKWLHPVAWFLERFISTPATHHAHHAATTNDGVGHYKGNFGNMFFIWDIIFKTGKISRKFPATYGMKTYQQEEWQAQIFWPFIKSKKEGSALAPDHLQQLKPEKIAPVKPEPVFETPIYIGSNEYEDAVVLK